MATDSFDSAVDAGQCQGLAISGWARANSWRLRCRPGDIRPATSMVEVRRLIAPDILVEIEADAVVPS